MFALPLRLPYCQNQTQISNAFLANCGFFSAIYLFTFMYLHLFTDATYLDNFSVFLPGFKLQVARYDKNWEEHLGKILCHRLNPMCNANFL